MFEMTSRLLEKVVCGIIARLDSTWTEQVVYGSTCRLRSQCEVRLDHIVNWFDDLFLDTDLSFE